MTKLQDFLNLMANDDIAFIQPTKQTWGFWSNEIDDQDTNYTNWDIIGVSHMEGELDSLGIEIAEPEYQD